MFCKAIAQGFFRAKKSTPEQVVVGLRDDSRRREKSLAAIRTVLGLELPCHEQFELGAFTMQNGLSVKKKRDSCGVASGRSEGILTTNRARFLFYRSSPIVPSEFRDDRRPVENRSFLEFFAIL